MPPTPRPNPDVITQELEGELVLVHMATNRIFALNETGARVWELLESGRDTITIRETLEREFAVDPQQLEREMQDLVAALAAEGLVEHDGG